ncbi:hypothetical protein MJO28_016868 [Puccinia striiformis f. sp. tritici]|nr:hypothetical protein MJO28_016868 [Puccinia striiformis f. sp. tritici]
MKPKKISEELQPEYPNHQITATRIYELGKRTKNQKTPEDTLVQQLLESLADSSFLNKTKYNKDGDINNVRAKAKNFIQRIQEQGGAETHPHFFPSSL